MDISTIGRYQILERLGQGGMGVVYRAFDPQIERTVAIKVISAQLVDQPEQRERFFREARAAGRLAHRNIITIFDLGEDRGQPYIAMEYVQGQALDVRMRTGEPLTLSQKLAIIADICDALAFAHGAGIIHRDMKPANVMLTTTGSVRILDFGLARLVTSELTRSNIVVGTMNYMAPEQVRAEPIDHRADVFSVGVLLYELLSGRKAFEADSFAATMYKVLQDRPAPLESLGHALPAELMTVVDRAIEKDREQRYQSMGDMLLDLQLVRAALPPAAPFRVFDSTAAGPPASSARGSARPLPELETTLDAPRVPAPGRTPPPSHHVVGSSTGPPVHATPVPGERPVSSHASADPSLSRSPSSASPAPGGTSQLLAMVSAAALVVIAIAVIAFVVREPDDRTSRRVDDTPRGASNRPAAPPPAAPAGASGTTGAPPAAPEAAVSVTDDLAQQTESARALYRAGKYDEAANAAGRVLKRSPDNAEAQRLMADVARYARQAATEAVSGLAAARTRAESAGAPAAAAAAFGRAVERERGARALLAARDYAKAATAAYAAQGLFDAAAAEALGRAQARAAAEPPATRTAPPPPAEEPRVPIQFPPVASVTPPPPAPAPDPAPAPPAASAPPRVPAAPERRAADPQEAIRRALQQVLGCPRGAQPAGAQAGLARARGRAGTRDQSGIRQRTADQRHARLAAHPGVGGHRDGGGHAALFAGDG